MALLPLPTKQQLAGVNWYRQAAAGKLVHVMYPFRACFDLTVRGERIPVYYDQTVTWLSARYEFYVYFGTECLERVARFYVDHVLTNRAQGASFHDEWKAAHYQPLIDRWAQRSIPTTLPHLFSEFREFSIAYRRAWNEAIFHDGFDYAGESLIREAANSNTAAAIDAVRHPFVSPYQEERRSLLAIGEAVLARGQIEIVRTAGSATALPDAIRSVLETHANRFHWIQNDYATARRLGPNNFLDRLKELVTDESHLAAERALSAALTAPTPRRFDDRTNRVVAAVSLVGAWRDERKALMQQAVAITHAFLEEISRLTGASIADMEWLDWTELEPWLNGDREITDRLVQRKTGVLHVAQGRELVECYGDRGLRLKRLVDQQVDGRSLRGRVAFRGQVRGTAKLIFDQRDFHKFQSGDILVAPNTRPEYLPIMRLAKAVVTEEGGLTSHAAIVARELSVPTIVGVQGVTSAIHDGDQIEVDADTGVVRKI